MIIEKKLSDGRIYHYSDQNFKILQHPTNKIYEDAVDVIPCIYNYEETNIKIEKQEVMPDAQYI